MSAGPSSAQFFEARYARAADPWHFATSPYEQNRYDTVLQALSRPRYGAVYEPGCSIGVLTARLCRLSDRVIAADVAPSAVRRARARCRDFPHATILRADVTGFVPDVPLDLVVFSEIGYYLKAGELERVATSLSTLLKRDGEFVAAHWLGHSDDHLLHGDEVHEILRCRLPLTLTRSERHRGFRLDAWARP